MLQDDDIRSLNALVTDGLSDGLPGSQAIKPLEEMLMEQRLTNEDLVFADRVGSTGLDGHLMLGDASLTATSLERVFGCLSGTGVHYNGMFGDGLMLRRPTAAATLVRGNRPAAPVAEQVVYAVHLLNSEQVSQTPEVLQAVQKHLSNLLLTYPALLHPNILMPVLLAGKREYVSVAAALATTPHGGLPRYSHFHPQVRTEQSHVGNRDDLHLVARLEAFAQHPCVVKSLSGKSTRVAACVDGVTPKFTRENLVRRLILKAGLPRVEYLASIMELDELHSPATQGSYVRQPFWATAQGEEAYVQQMYSVLAASVYAAAGSFHTAALTGHFPAPMRRHPVDLEFLALVKARGHLLLCEDHAFVSYLEKAMPRRIFLGRADEVPPEELQHNVRAAANALVHIGVAKTPAEACSLIATCCTGAKKNDEMLPRTDTTGAVAFLQVLDELGGLGDKHDQSVLAQIRDEIIHMPPRPIPFRDAWGTACDVVGNERAMNSVIAKAAQEAHLTSGAEHEDEVPAWAKQVALDFGDAGPVEAKAPEPAPVRRRRMAL